MRGWLFLFTISICVFNSSGLLAQRFNIVHYPQGALTSTGVAMVSNETDSSLVIAARTANISTQSDGLALFAVNSNDGTLLWESSFAFGNLLSLGRSGSLIITHNGGYAGTGSYGVGTLTEVLFVRWNAQGDTVLTRHFSTGHNCRGITLHQIQPNKYLIIGDREATSSSSSDIAVWAVDSLGNLLWQSYVPDYNNGNERVRSTVELPNGDVFISASTGLNTVHAIRMDTSGNIVWQKFYPEYHIMYCATADTGLVCFAHSENSSSQIFPYLQHVSYSGVLGDGYLLNQQYQRGSSGHDPFLDENGDVYGLGTKLSGGQQGYMRKIRQDGTVVWERTYTKGTGTHYVWDATPTPDGGYAFTGSTSVNGTGVWVVKVDRDGCEVPLCNISLEEHDEAELKFYPNPTQNRVTIELRELGSGTLYLYDVFGVLQKSEDVTSERPIVFWELEDLAKGQYIVVFEATSGIRTHAKLIVQ